MGPVNIHSGKTEYISLALGPAMDPYIAYRGNSKKITVKRFNAAKIPPAWDNVGAP